jgi:hypothetical protein
MSTTDTNTGTITAGVKNAARNRGGLRVHSRAMTRRNAVRFGPGARDVLLMRNPVRTSRPGAIAEDYSKPTDKQRPDRCGNGEY